MRASDSMAPTYAGGWDSATRLANLSPDRRLERQARLVVPRDLVAHRDGSADEHLRERTASPLRVHRGAESRHCFLHALARLHLASDEESRRTDTQDAPAAATEPAKLACRVPAPVSDLQMSPHADRVPGPASAMPSHPLEAAMSRVGTVCLTLTLAVIAGCDAPAA